MHKIKSEKGITLLILVITVVVLGLVSIPVSVSLTSVTELQRYTNFKGDIDKLREAIESVYGTSTDISVIGSQYSGDTEFLNKSQNGVAVKNPNDSSEYYIIDLTELNQNLGAQIELTYGSVNTKGTSDGTDVYIINGKSRTIYYVKGIEYEGETYYRLPEDFTSLEEVYAVTYDANGGTDAPSMESVSANSNAITIGAAPTRDGYEFLGYKIAGSDEVYNTGDIYYVTGDVTFIAQWKKEETTE